MPAITKWYSVQITQNGYLILKTALQLNKTQAENIKDFAQALGFAAPASNLTIEIVEYSNVE